MPGKPKTFQPASWRPAAERERETDSRRGSARERGYDTRWDKAAAQFRSANPLCRGCLALGRAVPAEVVDHVEPHKGDMVKFWRTEMWQASCAWHHDKIKAQLEALFERGQATIDDLWLDSALARRLAVGG
jgi:5-methylcytosine-specific restriction protein A